MTEEPAVGSMVLFTVSSGVRCAAVVCEVRRTGSGSNGAEYAESSCHFITQITKDVGNTPLVT